MAGFKMEKNKLPLRFTRIALMITLTCWALMLALGPFILFIAPIVFIYNADYIKYGYFL